MLSDGARLLSLAVSFATLTDVEISPENEEKVMRWLKDIVPVPIVTSGELESWNDHPMPLSDR